MHTSSMEAGAAQTPQGSPGAGSPAPAGAVGTYERQPSIPKGGLIVISGDSGVGKTHLLRQCLLDAEWGPERVMIHYAENPMMTLGEDSGAKHFRRHKNVESFVSEIERLVELRRSGQPFPWTLMFLDSLTGLADYQFMEYEDNPDRFKSWNEKRQENVKNEFAKYLDFGLKVCRACIRARDELDVDFVITATTYGRPPVYTVPGNIVPQNLNRWSSSCIYMESQAGTVDDDTAVRVRSGEIKVGPHRNLSYDTDQKKWIVITRTVTTMNTGEVLAKGHRNLSIREPAYLPSLLRKIHGTPEPKEV